MARFMSSSWCNLSWPSERTTIGCDGWVAGLSLLQAARVTSRASGNNSLAISGLLCRMQRVPARKGFLAPFAAAAKARSDRGRRRAIDQGEENRVVASDCPGHFLEPGGIERIGDEIRRTRRRLEDNEVPCGDDIGHPVAEQAIEPSGLARLQLLWQAIMHGPVATDTDGAEFVEIATDRRLGGGNA